MRPPRCVVCGILLLSACIRNVWGEMWCRSHRPPHCIWCTRVTGTRLDDGRPRCAACRASAVDGPASLEPLRVRVLAAFDEWFGPGRLGEIPVEATGGTLMVGGGRRVGRTHAVLAADVRSVRVTFSAGMPTTLAGTVLAHEYGHCLLAFDHRTLVRRPSPRLSSPDEEGFCEVLGAEWLRRFPTPDAAFHLAQMELRTDPVYGAGFRSMAARFAAVGSLPGLLAEATMSPAAVSRVKRPRRLR